MFLFLSIVTLLIGSSLGTTATGSLLNRFKGLKFADDANSYVQFTPDWSPFRNAVSACAWVRDLGSATYRPVFHIKAPWDELTMTADGRYIGIFAVFQQLQSKMSVAKGTWFHQCVTWGSSTRDHRVYLNGVEIGAQQTALGRLMRPTGALTLGNWAGGNSGWKFGGEMAYLNFYAKELSTSDIASMAQQGMCSNIADEDKNEHYRIIKWENLLELGRSGTVTDFDMLTECSTSYLLLGFERRLNKKLEDISSTLNSTLAELKECHADKEEKEHELEDVSNRLNSTLAELEETKADNFEMKQELDDISARLNSTVAELEQVTANRNASWYWDIFLAEQFLDQNLTAEHAQLLRSTWDDIAEALVGFRITDEFIKLMSRVDRVEDRPWFMLYSDNYFEAVFTQEMAERLTSIWDEISEKLVGVTMSRGVIELLNYVTEKANCDTDTSS